MGGRQGKYPTDQETRVQDMQTNTSPAREALPMLLGLLLMRLVLFAAFQAAIAFIAFGGEPDPWQAGVAWWPVGIVATNFLTIAIMIRLFRIEVGSYSALFRINRRKLGADTLPLIGLFIVLLALAILPNLGLATLLFETPESATDKFIFPLPMPVVWMLLPLFPISIALAELPLYFGYIMPRLEKATGSVWLAILLPAVFAAAQHITMPLLFDWSFIVWRLLMFIPFTVFLAIVLRWRPRYLPFFAIAHALLDISIVALILSVSSAA